MKPATVDVPTDALRAAKRHLEAAPVTLALLFGSRATGHAYPGSDIDIAVEYESSLEDETDVHLRLVADLTRSFDRDDIDVIRLTSVDPRVAVDALEHGERLVGTAEDINRLRDQLETARISRESEVANRIEAAEDRIERRLSHREYGWRPGSGTELLADLEQIREKKGVNRRQYVSNVDLQGIVERRLEKATQTCIDIGRLIGRLEGRDLHNETNADVFVELVDMSVLPDERRREFIDIGGLRNVLAHQYRDIDSNEIYDIYHDLERLERFSEAIYRYIHGESSNA